MAGWNRPSAEQPVVKKGGTKVPSVWKGIVAGLLVAVPLVALFVWMFAGDEVSPQEDSRKSGRIAERRPASVSKATERKVERKRAVEHPKTVEDALANVGEMPKPMINKRELTPEEWNRITNRTYSTCTEQIMSWIFTKQLGDVPMPIPPIDDRDRDNLVAILISKNPVTESDSEKTAMSKEAVAAAKKAMIEYIKEGGDPDDFLQYYGQEMKNAYEYRRMAEEQIDELLEEGDLPVARGFIRKMNEVFDEKGIKPIYETQYRILNENPEDPAEESSNAGGKDE